MTRFSLSDSPFRNIHKYHDDDILDYLDPRLREFVWQYREKAHTSLPPCAFVFGPELGSFVFGFSHPTPGAFLEQAKYEAKHLLARRAFIMAEATSLSSPRTASLLILEVQKPQAPFLRCAYDLLRPGRMPVSDDWALPSDSDIVVSSSADPVVQMTEESERTSRIVGVSYFFSPLFT